MRDVDDHSRRRKQIMCIKKMCRKLFFVSQIILDTGRSSYDVMSVFTVTVSTIFPRTL